MNKKVAIWIIVNGVLLYISICIISAHYKTWAVDHSLRMSGAAVIEKKKEKDKYGDYKTISLDIYCEDGSVREVTKYWESIANDPYSLQFRNWSCSLDRDEMEWMVSCDWASKTGFGGYEWTHTIFFIKDGKVVE